MTVVPKYKNRQSETDIILSDLIDYNIINNILLPKDKIH